MMEYLRKFLIFLRKQDNQDNLKPAFIVRLLIITVVGIIVGILIDTFLPFNFFLNMIRGVIANTVGFASSSYLYLISLRFKRNKLIEDKYYQSIRKRFSYRQRVNISIVIGTIVAIFTLLGTKHNPAYTFRASLTIMSAIVLLMFTRRGRNEFLKDIYEIPDTRDLEFLSKKNKKKEDNENKINKGKDHQQK